MPQGVEETHHSNSEDLPSFVTTRSGRVSKPPEKLRDFYGNEVNEQAICTQKKTSGKNSPGEANKTALRSETSQNHIRLSLLKSFVSFQATEKVLSYLRQAPYMNLEFMLMNILENKTAVGRC